MNHKMKRVFSFVIALIMPLLLLFPSDNLYADTRTKLATPTNVHWVEGETATLAWDAVENANYYSISIYKADGTYCGLASTVFDNTNSKNLVSDICNNENYYGVLDGENLYATVTAIVSSSDESIYLRYMNSDPSQPSETITYHSPNVREKLATPTNVHWVEGETATVAWDGVDNAYYYTIDIYRENGRSFGNANTSNGNVNSFNLVSTICNNENYYGALDGERIYVKVRAVVNPSDSNMYLRYMNSDPSISSGTITYHAPNTRERLATPTNVRWVEGETATLAWDAVTGAFYYHIDLYKENGTFCGTASTTNGTTVSMDLVPDICFNENSFGVINGQNIYVKVTAMVNSLDESINLRYMNSEASSPSPIKRFVRPMVIDTGNGVEIVETNALYNTLRNSLSASQLAASDGKQLEFDFNVTNMSDGDAGTGEINTYAANHDYTIGNFFDLTLTVKADGASIGNVTVTAATVPLTVDIPTGIRRTGRTFFILRNHEGTITVVGTGTGNSVPISTNQFSTYAIAYSDSYSSPSSNLGTSSGENGADIDSNDNGSMVGLGGLRQLISEAAIKGGEQTIYWSEGNSLPYDIMKSLEDNPQITLVFNYMYKNEYYSVVIPGKNVKADVSIPWYGPRYLYEKYGLLKSAKKVNSTATSAAGYYVVKAGDNLSSIAKRFKTNIDNLVRKNSINNPDLIFINQKIEY